MSSSMRAEWEHLVFVSTTAPRPRPARALAALTRRALGTLRRRRALAHQRRELLRVAEDPHLLADVGLTRERALAEARRTFPPGV